VAKTPAAQAPQRNPERLYAQVAEQIRRQARATHEQGERLRRVYRRRLDAWLTQRARLDQRQAAARREQDATLDALRAEHEHLGRELATLQTRLKRMDASARQLDLLAGYLTSTDPSAPEPIIASEEEEAALPARIIQAQEAERQRLAEDVHDGPAQVLTNAIFQVEYLDRVIDESPRTAHAELAYLRTMLRDGLDDVRAFITELRPPVVDVGLARALADKAGEFGERHGIEITVGVNGIDARLDPPGKASVLRIVGEALQNVHKHAAATEVAIGLEGDTLTIADNGRGFDVMRLASGASRNFGLQFMRERAELMGASLQIESRQGEGTRILLRLPEHRS
jgi:two-component system sensor histidine kinase DegS